MVRFKHSDATGRHSQHHIRFTLAERAATMIAIAASQVKSSQLSLVKAVTTNGGMRFVTTISPIQYVAFGWKVKPSGD
jgi:hypothetical protein